MDKQINHDNHYDESKTRTQIPSKLPDDGDHWAPNNLTEIQSKRKTPVEPGWAKQQTRSSGPNQLKLIALCRGPSKSPTHRHAIKCSNCCKIVFDHLRLHLNASNAALMCRIGAKYKYTIHAVCAYAPVCAYAHVFQKWPGFALIGACVLFRMNTLF